MIISKFINWKSNNKWKIRSQHFVPNFFIILLKKVIDLGENRSFFVRKTTKFSYFVDIWTNKKKNINQLFLTYFLTLNSNFISDLIYHERFERYLTVLFFPYYLPLTLVMRPKCPWPEVKVMRLNALLLLA